MKYVTRTIIILVFISLFFSCSSTPKKDKEKTGKSKEPVPAEQEIQIEVEQYPPRIIEHQNSAVGGEVPGWYFMHERELEQQPEYMDLNVFKFYQNGEALEEFNTWRHSFQADVEIAKLVTFRVMDRFDRTEMEYKETVRASVEEMTMILDVAAYAGTRKQFEFWVFQQTFSEDGEPAEKSYRFLLLYTVPKAQVNSALQIALKNMDEKSTPETEEEIAAYDWVIALFREGL